MSRWSGMSLTSHVMSIWQTTRQTDKWARDPPADQSGQHTERPQLLFLVQTCYGEVGD